MSLPKAQIFERNVYFILLKNRLTFYLPDLHLGNIEQKFPKQLLSVYQQVCPYKRLGHY